MAAVEPGKDLFLNIRVIPSARLDRLEEVLVITKIQDKLPDTADLGPIRASDILSQRLPGVPAPQGVDKAGNAATPAAGAANAAPGGTAAGTTTTPGGTALPGGASPTRNSGKPDAAAVSSTQKTVNKPAGATPANAGQAPQVTKPRPQGEPPQ